MKKTSVIVIGAAAAVGVVGISFGKKIKTLYQSLNSFKDKNLAHTFQHTPDLRQSVQQGDHRENRRRLGFHGKGL